MVDLIRAALEAGDLARGRSWRATTWTSCSSTSGLPDGNGLSLIPSETERTDDTPSFVVLSASVLPTEKAVALAAGAADFLAKPYRPSDLVEAVVEQLPARS